MRLSVFFALVAVAFLASGCCSILSDKNYNVSVSSPTPGTPVTITNQAGQQVHTGTTPFTVTLPAYAGFFDGETYTVKTPSGTAVVDSSLDPWYFGNIIFGGLIGMLIVDPATGAMFKLPENVTVN